MSPKFILGILCLTSLAVCSCSNSNDKPSSSTSATTTPATETSQPGISAAGDISSLENTLRTDSLNIELRTSLAANYYSAGNLNKAAYHFSIVRMIDPKNLNALKNLGNISYDGHQDEKAIRYYEEALAIQPNDINMKCDLATCYSRINKLKKATDILKGNIKSDFNHAQSHYNLSVILEQDGKMKEAAEEMKIYKQLTAGKK